MIMKHLAQTSNKMLKRRQEMIDADQADSSDEEHEASNGDMSDEEYEKTVKKIREIQKKKEDKKDDDDDDIEDDSDDSDYEYNSGDAGMYDSLMDQKDELLILKSSLETIQAQTPQLLQLLLSSLSAEENSQFQADLAKTQEVHDTEERLKKEYEARKQKVKEGREL